MGRRRSPPQAVYFASRRGVFKPARKLGILGNFRGCLTSPFNFRVTNLVQLLVENRSCFASRCSKDRFFLLFSFPEFSEKYFLFQRKIYIYIYIRMVFDRFSRVGQNFFKRVRIMRRINSNEEEGEKKKSNNGIFR